MSTTTIGMIAGLALGFAVAFGGFSAFIIVAAFGAFGLAIGWYLDGKVDLTTLLERRSRR